MRIDYPRAGRSGVRRWLPSLRQTAALFAAGVLTVIGLAVAAYAMVDVPDPNEFSTSQSTIITYRNGAEIGRLSAQDRTSVPLTRVPEHVQKAVLAAENRSFYSDSGISPKGIVRAFWTNLRGGATQGGSTITQQYVKNSRLSSERTYLRKLKEAVISIKLDKEYSKDQILEDYLNTIYFGRGAYGIQTASQTYFDKDVGRLTVAEGAVLAAIIRSPGSYDPVSHRQALRDRWGYVLDGMVQEGWLTPERAARAKFPRIAKRSTEDRLAGPKGYLIKYVENELVKLGYDEDQLPVEGLRVRTTFDEDAQQAAVDSVEKQAAKMRKAAPKKFKGVHVGLTAVEPGTGEVVAMYGGRNYVERQFNDATQAKVQPGSSVKAFTLAAALDSGISLRSRYDGNSGLDVPGSKPVDNEFDYSYGPVDLLTATEKSINTAFVDLTLDVGPSKVLDAMVKAGIPRDSPGLNPDARITLGTASVPSIDMADGYATFAAEGEHAAPFSVLEVKTANGGTDYKAKPDTGKAFDKDVVRDVTYALQQVVENPNGTGTEAQALGRPAAAKTGTAEDLTAWFCGYTPQLSAAVTIFKGNGRVSLDGVGGLSTFFGGAYPARIWTGFMKGALEGKPVEDFPPPAFVGDAVDPTPTFTPSEEPTTETPTPTTTSPTPTPTPTTTSPTPTPTATTTSPTPTPTKTTPSPTATTTVPLPTRTTRTTQPPTGGPGDPGG